jgi:Protein of unknown function (DUF2652)
MRSQEGFHSREGYLLLADISGYTAFFTGSELDHAQAIIHELTSLIRGRLSPPTHFVKLEGDAVFCYADAVAFRDAERFLELIEACYFDFSNQLDDMVRERTCRCNACATISSLGLKFVAHYGSFIVERDLGREDLAGPDVILVHRLLKNSISESSGPHAYAFLSDACLAHMPATMAFPKHSESYDSFGEVTGGVHDLAPVLAEMREARRHFITREEADYETVVDVPVPPSVAWKYYVDPIERQRWACRQFGKDPDELDFSPGGRSGLGSATHCGHGPGRLVAHRMVIDWRPFSYFTCESVTPAAGAWIGGRPAIETFEFTPCGDCDTRIVYRLRIIKRGRLQLFAFRAARPLLRAYFRRWTRTLHEIVREDAHAIGLDEMSPAN